MSRTESADRPENLPFGGYHQTWEGGSDEILTRVGPGTPCGEYLRRYWHPVAMTSELEDVPLPRRILGEDLILFRDGRGEIGLVHKNCPHRRASLEYGVCEARGIRCCYHGWLFDVDGTILETPGEPEGCEAAARVRRDTRLGAYPVKEYRGLVFAYLGPPEALPEFPHYDTFNIPDLDMVPYRAPFDCNWLQVLDAILDPVHTAFLHSRISREQFSRGFGELGELEFYEKGLRFLGSSTRRVGENAWVRVNELILPNFTQAGAAFAADGTQQRYFGRSAFTRWVVPLDDTHTVAYAWANFGERGDPQEWNNELGPQLIEQGEPFERSYEERQRRPGDLEAVEGMGPITDHQKEHLMQTDRGVALYRRRIRRHCRDLEKGKAPPAVMDLATEGRVTTYGCDTVLHFPVQGNDDRKRLHDLGKTVMDIKFAAESLPDPSRDETIIAQLKELEEVRP